MSYGSVAVDSHRPTADFPGLSMLTGLLTHALGWRHPSQAHLAQRLQDRIRYAARNEALASSGHSTLTDFHTAQLAKDDTAWTTNGVPEYRTGSPASYTPPHTRSLQYHANLRTTVALTLDPEDDQPALTDLAHALLYPDTILFIGRKACPPSDLLMQDILQADTALEALARTPSASSSRQDPVQWNGQDAHPLVTKLTEEWTHDLRDWANEIHTGRRLVATGLMSKTGNPSITGGPAT